MTDQTSSPKAHLFSRTPLRAWHPDFVDGIRRSREQEREDQLENVEDAVYRIFWIVMGVLFLLFLCVVLYVQWRTRLKL